MAKLKQIENDLEFLNKTIGKLFNVPNKQNTITGVKNGFAIDNKKRITELNLDNCQLEDISFLAKFDELQKVSLCNNKIINISSFENLKNLTYIDLSNNLISDLVPLKNLKKLKILDLKNNKIDKLPVWILDFCLDIMLENSWEDGIYLQDNPLRLPPPEIIKQGNAAIKAYLNDLEKQLSIDFTGYFGGNIYWGGIDAVDNWNNTYDNDAVDNGINNRLRLDSNIALHINEASRIFSLKRLTKNIQKSLDTLSVISNNQRTLNELKVIFIGDGGAGKTSLSKLLRDQTFDPHENQTHGINIDDWKVGDITAHLWDFGGQEILRATHKFFLSKRSLYVLVLDNREERDEERWLKRIESFGGNSPILIVLNKCDQNFREVDRRDLVRRYSGLQPNDFYPISCANGQGIEAFKQGLIAAFNRVELINSVLPESWFQVKTALEQQQRQQHYISYDRYIEICQQQQIADTQTQDILARLLHDLGVSVHFEDLALLDTHVLEPKWITEGVYKIITSPKLTEQQGVLNLVDLPAILKPRSDLPGFKNLEGLNTAEYVYPPTKYAYLLELMKKFELSYRLNDRAVLIPQLLKPEEPEFAFDDSGQVLRFQILYDYLDDSIMPRFIVALHQDIDNRIQWRKGVLLHNRNLKSQTVVRVNYQDRLLTIVVKGEQKRDYFAVIRKALHDIHASFEWKKPPIELVPLPDNPEFTVEYEELIGYEQMGKDDYPVGKLRKVYSVSELLNGIEKPEQRQHSHQTTIINTQNYVEGNVNGGSLAGRDIDIK